ncbi:MAG: hypothetical protein J6X81_03450 [Muribaculaceae bacterium]|nr:hypothetical protein [Muribaculaceae bacterium]
MKRIALILLALTVFVPQISAQADSVVRRITPVRPATNTVLTPPKGTSEEIIRQYVVGDTAQAKAQERKDSLRKIYPHYPILTDVTFGINILDPVLMAFGQKYGGVDLSATLNMWNRLQPVIEVGLGRAKVTPDDQSYTYKGKLSPYFRVGFNYNLLFKKEPAYQAFVGLRLGYSTFRYDITDITLKENYWKEERTLDITGEKSHALWGEIALGLRVKVWKNISAGWQVKYHGIFNYKSTENSRPWYIPGYGPRNSSLAATLSIYYTLPLMKDRWPVKTEVKQDKVSSKKSLVTD